MNHKSIKFGNMPKHEHFLLLQLGKTERQHLITAMVFSRMMERLFPIPAGVLASFVILGRPDNGQVKYDVALQFDSDDERSADFADRILTAVPRTWDKEAGQELAMFERSASYYAVARDKLSATVQKFSDDALPACDLTAAEVSGLLGDSRHALH